MKIKTLNPETINKIAAGEVIIRPSSVVKELVENSIDSGATRITVRIKEGGKKEIQVRDDGCGINYDEIPLAFKRHATSKINFLEDLDELDTMGFRGEALSSIVSVADVTIITRAEDEEIGSRSEFRDGILVNRKVEIYEKGTEITVSDIFVNIPARFKFLKKDTTEERKIREVVQKLAMAHPNIIFEFFSDDRLKFRTIGNGNLLDTATSIFGKAFTEHLHFFEVENLPMKVFGLIGDLDARRNNRDNQIFYINDRFVKSPLITKLFEEEWEGMLMKHQFPSGIIFIEVPQKMLDVNVHPQKTEIRVLNKSLISILFKQSIRQALNNIKLIPETHEETVEEYEARIQETKEPEPSKPEVEQQNFTPLIEKTLPIIQKEAVPEIDETISEITKSVPKENENSFEKSGLISSQAEPSFFKDKDEPVSINHSIERTDLRPNEKEVVKPLDFSRMKFIGQVFDTYLILEDQGELFYIDQHAAHEGILYDEFRSALFSKKQYESQNMLIPQKVDATFVEIERFDQIKDRLEQFGFKAFLKDNELYVNAVPVILDTIQLPELIIPMINYFSGSSSNEPDFGLNKIITMSCKAAIKGGDSLNRDEIDLLLNRLQSINNPYTCPHGRPIIRKQSKHELERLFKRIV